MKSKHLLQAVLLLAVCMVAAGRVARAVPSLQLYSPDAEYDENSESWLTHDSPYELQVAGARSPNRVDRIEDVRLWIALPQEYQDEQYAANGPGVTAEVTRLSDGQVIAGLDSSNLLGPAKPELGGREIPPHGAHPSRYWEVQLEDLDVAGAGDTVYDYDKDFDPQNPGTGHPGDIHRYEISYAPHSPDVMLHVDAGGHLVGADGTSVPSEASSYRFAPFSHDAEATATPEPSTLTLFAVLLGGVGLVFLRSRWIHPGL